MRKKLFLVLVFGSIGITSEVFFTALSDVVFGEAQDARLQGHSYIWMFPIYGIGVLLFEKLSTKLKGLHVFPRILIYGLLIILVEFICGFALDLIVGSCPWHYTSGIHIMGFARLDYLPFWMIFAFFGEKLLHYIIEKDLA